MMKCYLINDLLIICVTHINVEPHFILMTSH